METRQIEFFKKSMSNALIKAQNGKIILTDFLDEAEQSIIQGLSFGDVKVSWSGGFLEAERQRALLLPTEDIKEDFQIVLFEIIYNKRFLTLQHRAILGSLMSLGIERNQIGDIVLKEDHAYFTCTKQIASYIKLELTQISGVPISLEECHEVIEVTKEKEYQNVILPSMRLDVVIAHAFHCSRSEAVLKITEGLVFVNHVLCQNVSLQLKPNDLISLRHKGRVYIEEIIGKTRSDRLNVKLGFLK